MDTMSQIREVTAAEEAVADGETFTAFICR